MNNAFIRQTRVILIRLGKVIPFVICAIILVSYCESVYALTINDYIEFNDGIYLNKPISWFIGEYFKYDIASLFIIVVLSFAIETCFWNKLACLYLGINLYEKYYFPTIELYEEYIYAICLVNICICGLLVYKGIKILTT